MSVIIGNQRDKKEYFKKEAEKLRRRADGFEQAENQPEAARLSKLADELDLKAQAQEEEIKRISGQ